MAATVIVMPQRNECTACGRPTWTHSVNGRWVGCTRDVTVMQDQATSDRRRRLQLIQASRMARVTVKPWGIEP